MYVHLERLPEVQLYQFLNVLDAGTYFQSIIIHELALKIGPKYELRHCFKFITTALSHKFVLNCRPKLDKGVSNNGQIYVILSCIVKLVLSVRHTVE